MLILACDIGSSYTKIALLRGPQENLKESIQANQETAHPIICASYSKYLPLDKQDGAAWRQLLCDIVGIIYQQGCQRHLEAICISSHGPSLLAIDQHGLPIASPYNPIHRNSPQISIQAKPQDDDGSHSFYLPLARAMWALLPQEQRRQVACILPPANYIGYLLTGELRVPIPQHYAQFYWPEFYAPATSPCAIDRQFLHLLPRLCAFTDIVGYVQGNSGLLPLQISLPDGHTCQEWQGVPVFCPGVDFFAAEAGLSSHAQDMLRNRTGTSQGLSLRLPAAPSLQHDLQGKWPQAKLPRGYFLNYHVVSQQPLLSYVWEGGGKLFEQLFQLWSSHPLQVAHYCEGTQRAQGSLPPDGLNKLPNGWTLHCDSHRQRNNMLQHILLGHSARELVQANRFAAGFVYSGLPTSTFFPALQRELALAPLDPLCLHSLPATQLNTVGLCVMQFLVQYFRRQCDAMFGLYRQLAAAEPPNPCEVLLSGGQGHYPIWLQWKARYSGMNLHIPNICDAEFIGAAAICYHRLGYFAGIEQASLHFFSIAQTYAP